MERRFANGFTREELRKLIIETALENGRPSGEIFRGLRAFDRVSDDELAIEIEQIANELALDIDL